MLFKQQRLCVTLPCIHNAGLSALKLGSSTLHKQRASLTASKTLLLPKQQHREKEKKNTAEEEREIEATWICKQRALLQR